MSNNFNRSRMAYPTGEISTSAVMVDLVTPQTARLGQNYEYQIHVTNLTNTALQNVAVTNESFQNLGVSSSNPVAASNSGGEITWNLGDFAAMETKVIRVTGKADKAGISSNCLSVTYANVLCGAVQIVEPKLELTKAATAEALACDMITLTYVASNKGTASLDNVIIKDTLANGLTVDGKNIVEINVGTLAPGAIAERKLTARAANVGSFASPATASSGDLTTAPASAGTIVKKPALSVTCSTGEGRSIMGRDVAFNVVVKNTSDVAAASSMVMAALPAGTTFVSATDGGTASGNGVSWNLGSLAAGQERKFSFMVRPSGTGSLKSVVSVSGTCVDTKTSECIADVVGIPALLMSGVDDPDPVVVGTNVTYTITLTNQGFAQLTNVKLVTTLEDAASMKYISSDGPTVGTAAGNVINFAPIATMAPKEVRIYRIVVQALKEGQVSFKAESNSTEITRTLIKTETTNFYK